MRPPVAFILVIPLLGAVAAPVAAQAPMTNDEILPGITLTVEDVEPGVFRVVNDGYRNLTTPLGSMRRWYTGAAADYIYPGLRSVIVGDSGSVWRTAECVGPTTGSQCVRLYRVGRAGEWEVDPAPVSFWDGQVDAGLDGRLWALAQDGPRVFDDGAWKAAAHRVEGDFDAIAVQADGTVWLKSEELCWMSETSTGCTDWTDVHDGDVYAHFVVTDDGVVWFMTEPAKDGSISFLRFDGADWQVVPTPVDYPGDPTSITHPVGMTPDGGVRWTAGDAFVQHESLTRLDEQGWTTFTSAEGVSTWGGQQGEWDFPTDMLKVGPDGSAWVNATDRMTEAVTGRGVRTCEGVARFDGDRWHAFLAGHCVSDLDFAPDGSVWVVALDRVSREVSTYVIAPESVATSG